MIFIIQLEKLTSTDLFDQFEKQTDRNLLNRIKNYPNEQLSVRKVLNELGFSKLTDHNYIRKGFISRTKMGRRVFIRKKDLEDSLLEVISLKFRRNG